MPSCTTNRRKQLLESELSRIVEILRRDYGPEKIILKDTSEIPIDRILEISRLIEPRVGIDLFVYTPEEMGVLLEEKYACFTRIVAKGRVLHEKRN